VNTQPHKILVVQTAFIGDVVLTLPLVQSIKQQMPDARIDMIAIPNAAGLLRNHPAINEIIPYDKRGKDGGFGGFTKLVRKLKETKYHAAVVPHRSIRSAFLARMANIPVRIGFTTSSGKYLYTNLVRYEQQIHEIDRNRSLVIPLGIEKRGRILPDLYPSPDDKENVDAFFSRYSFLNGSPIVAIAPGSVWNTKRWLKENYIGLTQKLAAAGIPVVLIGGKDDERLCGEIRQAFASNLVISAAGKFSLLQSAELLRRCTLLVSNDSAPTHLAVAMRTRVVAIFGATSPRFGFAPYGDDDEVVEISGLKCKPCSIHGGNRCPIKTFDCMVQLTADQVFQVVMKHLDDIRNQRGR
jgi:heptosyltransferase II